MPITESKIIEDSLQADGRRWVTEEHIDSTGKKHQVRYLAEARTDVDQVIADRVAVLEQSLIDAEINRYIVMVETGQNVVNATYTETDQPHRAAKFYEWVQRKIAEQDYQALKYTPGIIDQFTEADLDGLLGSGKGSIIKDMVEKIRAMNAAVVGLEV